MTVLWIILGMSIVTVLPRLIPILIVGRAAFPKWMNRFLAAIPYAALGALIFPGILSIDQANPMMGLIGGLVAIVLAYLRLHVLLVIAGAILTVALLGFFM